MNITLLVDNKKSWYYPYAERLAAELASKHTVTLISNSDEVPSGDIAFFLSCERLIKKSVLERNNHNLVVHSSPLPQGKGWSPLTWQILEGKTEIVSTLFEAVAAVDAGSIYFQDTIHFKGHELLPELHAAQGESVNRLVHKFIDNYQTLEPQSQVGEETFYRRRKPEDSEIDPNKTIAEQFDVLRVVDNESYPAFFTHRGQKYILKIYKSE